ncbi:transcription cofactor vestigial-like protein 2a isoform X2 [Phyllopteryx taeniolatus]|uniref:transcription cofactor vestigial-like protein 2a isoform X2 n=1 Tax=Phyllopteryx taeniolatus TaxID=161469 RepID=UPI002AD5449C|nr:transcription cofactor vestigial-like protein 2a isoform X2 [Phyllopteryx taeniolatus]
MSCLDVMYQVLGAQPYFTSYTPYHHHQQQQQKLALDWKMQDPQDAGSSNRLGPPGSPTIKEEDKELPPGAEYLNARCVLFTYFHGDISAVIDQHFSRALSHASSSSSSSYPPSSHKTPKDGSFPMSQRNFPASFWNSSYPSPVPSSLASALSAPHSELAFAAGDPYAPSPLHGHLHQPGPDAWHPSHPHHHHHHHPYSLGGSMGAQGSTYPRPAVHEVYGAAFDPRYGSLLVPSVRPHHCLASSGGSACDLGGKGESAAAWSGSFSGVGEIGLNMDAGLQTQDKSKDLYWF